MGRSAGNQEMARATMELVTKEHLKEWGFAYDELYFGKPSFDIAFDDKAFNADSLEKITSVLGITMPTAEPILEYRVSQVEKKLETFDATLKDHSSKIEAMFKSIEGQLGAYLQRTSALEIRHETLADIVDEVKSSGKTQDAEITELKVGMVEKVIPGAIAGVGTSGLIAGIIEVVKYFTGHT